MARETSLRGEKAPGVWIVGAALAGSLALAAAGTGEPPPPKPAPPSSQEAEGGGRFGETVEVRLAELYVVVTDAAGRPVPGLAKSDFVVREGDVAQTLESATDSRELPITVGLAVDTSASMFAKLGVVANAARGLLEGLSRGRDRAFLVGFGPRPELVEPTTGDLFEVSDALAGLEASGTTPLWASITYSLGELEKARGKRALVLLSDGADDDGSRAFADCYRKVRSVGAPVYLVIVNNEAARSSGRDFQTRLFISRLERVAKAGGGRVYFVSTREDVGPVYRQIEAELRSAYLLTYYPQGRAASGEPGPVAVALARRGLKARTVSSAPPAR